VLAHGAIAVSRNFTKPIDCMDVVFFVLSFAAVVVLFGSVIASLAWLILRMLRLLIRLLAKY